MIYNLLRISTLLGLISLLTACFPPMFYSIVNIYAVDNGNDVGFILKVGNGATSVTCFNGNVVLTNSEGDTWNGTADYTNDLGGAQGTTTVNCTAINGFGSLTSNVGTITLIPNSPPQIVMLPTVTICGNDGSLTVNEPLVDGNSQYMTGATYLLTAGSLTSLMTINATNGNLNGTPTAGTYSDNLLKITATTAAGSDESLEFTIQYSAAACP